MTKFQISSTATTTPKIRREIQLAPSNVSDYKLAKKYGITRGTVRKWRKRTTIEDQSRARKTYTYALTDVERLVVTEVRKMTWWSAETLVEVLKKFIPKIHKRNVERLFVREGISRKPKEKEEEKPVKKFKNYKPGFLHIDVKYLPKIQGKRTYLFVAIDRATRLVYIEVYENQTKKSAVDFAQKCTQFFSFKITKILTDNGTLFTDRQFSKNKQPSGKHLLDVFCKNQKIEHRNTKFFSPQTNGMVERRNRQIQEEVLDVVHFESVEQMSKTLQTWMATYNLHIKQRVLKFHTPFEKLKEFAKNDPKLLTQNLHKFKQKLSEYVEGDDI